METAEQFFDGTNFESLFKEALWLMECGYENADITIITDGECRLPPKFTEEFRKQAYKATVTGSFSAGGRLWQSTAAVTGRFYLVWLPVFAGKSPKSGRKPSIGSTFTACSPNQVTSYRL